MSPAPAERRQFKRLHAPVFCRPLGRSRSSGSTETPRREVLDISLGGIRVYTDDRHSLGDRLELELWLPDGQSLTLDTSVVWVDPLEGANPARFELGLRFVDAAANDLERLQTVLKEA